MKLLMSTLSILGWISIPFFLIIGYVRGAILGYVIALGALHIRKLLGK
jgi:hypothetical protein